MPPRSSLELPVVAGGVRAAAGRWRPARRAGPGRLPAAARSARSSARPSRTGAQAETTRAKRDNEPEFSMKGGIIMARRRTAATFAPPRIDPMSPPDARLALIQHWLSQDLGLRAEGLEPASERCELSPLLSRLSWTAAPLTVVMDAPPRQGRRAPLSEGLAAARRHRRARAARARDGRRRAACCCSKTSAPRNISRA